MKLFIFLLICVAISVAELTYAEKSKQLEQAYYNENAKSFPDHEAFRKEIEWQFFLLSFENNYVIPFMTYILFPGLLLGCFYSIWRLYKKIR